MSTPERAPDPAPPAEPPELSAVLPCHEEAENLADTLDAVLAGAAAAGVRTLEVVLVCTDRARDGTPALARARAARDPRVRVVTQGRVPAGYGGAVRLGLAAARAPWVLLCDADGQLDPRELPRLWSLHGSQTAVFGVRTPRRDSGARRLAARAYRAAATLALAGLAVPVDPDCALKLLPRAPLVAARLRATSGAVNLELVAALARRGVGWVEVPVTHRPRRAGTPRFELERGPFAGLPRPSAALELLGDVVRLAGRRLVARARGHA
ncbi:MAG: glycosyltransferase [Polyangiaceae bacterium]|nr:glycosyltransferase [Polyangiaceae bacterium]